MFAVIVNTVAIVIGTTLGLLFKKGLPEQITQVMMKIMGLCVVIIGIQNCIQEKSALILILSCVIGVMIGEALDLDGCINRGSEKLVARFARNNSESNADSELAVASASDSASETTAESVSLAIAGENFAEQTAALQGPEQHKFSLAEACINSTLIMSVGAMVIVGSLDAGLKGDFTMLYTKSLLDLISGIMLGATMGVGVYGSAPLTFLIQGAIVLASAAVAPFLSDALILEMSCSGGLMIIAIGTNMMELTDIKVLNLVPAFLVVPFALQLMIALGLY